MKDNREAINAEELKDVNGGSAIRIRTVAKTRPVSAEVTPDEGLGIGEGVVNVSGNNGDPNDDNLTSEGTETGIRVVGSRWAMLG